jgi:hypothetical protein
MIRGISENNTGHLQPPDVRRLDRKLARPGLEICQYTDVAEGMLECHMDESLLNELRIDKAYFMQVMLVKRGTARPIPRLKLSPLQVSESLSHRSIESNLATTLFPTFRLRRCGLPWNR